MRVLRLREARGGCGVARGLIVGSAWAVSDSGRSVSESTVGRALEG
jgi:hypothetical protein